MPGLGLIYTPSVAFKVSPTAQSQPTASQKLLEQKPVARTKEKAINLATKLWSREGQQTNQ